MKLIYPVEGRIVRDPVTGRELTKAGVTVDENDSFWLRRLADGDVTEEEPAEEDAEEVAEQNQASAQHEEGGA
ncbi:DUF2635 domain-containing protein [Herbaspirillum camelliae]|uniref:DUF2635 domain-containing protein n=1 Tax=Herbaspirillum camelliae TaxID=1892903 RepID=UPI000949F022|nr:DUF2635 domain-containing protein [Herbaspirillum camelliae]